jgi:hypothetical protein
MMKVKALLKDPREPRIIQFPKISDPRGNLTFIEGRRHVPFRIRRTYWVYDVPGGEVRGGHAYRELEEVIIALAGSFDVLVDLGQRTQIYTLNRSYFGLYVPRLVWRQLIHFSTNSVALFLASLAYSKDDYILNYKEFRRIVRNENPVNDFR